MAAIERRTVRVLGRGATVIGAAGVGAFTVWLFGGFATYPDFPTITEWARYPEPWARTWRTLLLDAGLAVGVGVALAVLLRSIRRLPIDAPVRAAIRVVCWAAAAWVLVYGWEPTARDVIGTEPFYEDPVAWPVFTWFVGTALVCGGVLAGAVDTGLRATARAALGRGDDRPVARGRVLAARWLVAAGVMGWMWITPWRTADRVLLSVLATALVAAWLARSHTPADGTAASDHRTGHGTT